MVRQAILEAWPQPDNKPNDVYLYRLLERAYEKKFLDYPYHQFPADNEAKRKLAEIYVELKPDITFVHNTEDHWPDHANSGIAARPYLVL